MSNGKANRNKGHRLERLIAMIWREVLGFKHTRTSRQDSRILDNCGVDIANIPMLIQCKSGYDKRFPKYRDIYEYIKENIKENYPKKHEIHTLPIVLIHKNSSRGKQNFVWQFAHEDIIPILSEYYMFKEQQRKDEEE